MSIQSIKNKTTRTRVLPWLFLISICFLTVALYNASFTNFFFQDDFFNLTLALKQSPLDAINIFKKPILDFYFYRPLSTQVFWRAGFSLFGWNVFGYHLVTFLFFLLNILLVYLFTAGLSKNKKIALLTAFFYGLSATHFYRLFFLSQFQEILLGTFIFSSLIFYLRTNSLVVLTFILALMTKETAVVLPAALLGLDFLLHRKIQRKLWLLVLVDVLYLLIRFKFFGFAQGEVYHYNFSPKAVLNNFFWYSIWSLGLPEHYSSIKLFVRPTLLNLKLVTGFGAWGNRILVSLIFFVTFIGLVLKFHFRKIITRKEFWLALGIFGIFLLPVAFYPFHKFAYSLTVPLLGTSLFLAVIFRNLSGKALGMVVLTYLFITLTALEYNKEQHWATGKAQTGQKVFAYFRENFPYGVDQAVYFRNYSDPFCKMRFLKKSSEVSYGIGGSDGLRLLYHRDDLPVYFEDFDNYVHFTPDMLVLDSRQFVR